MCIPIAVALAAASVIATVGKGVMDHQAQIRQAREQKKLMDMQASAIRESALETKKIDMEAHAAQEQEVRQSAALDTFERTRQARRDAAMTRVSTSEAGVLGNTLNTELANTALNSSFDIGILEGNMNSALAQVDRERMRTDANYKSRINEANTLVAQGKMARDMVPSGMASSLSIGFDAAAAGASTYTAAGGTIPGSSGNPGATFNGGYTRADLNAINR